MTIETPVIAGNWKLNHGPSEAAAFFRELLPQLDSGRRGTVALFPPAISFAAAREAAAAAPDILLGVQNVYWQANGAFTGEISASLASDAGARLVLVGHSERRHVFGEGIDDTVKKVRSVFDAGLLPVLCVGEQLDEREAGDARQVVEQQLGAVLDILTAEEAERFLVAYEPVWAIGTGRTASPDDAAEMHGHIRSLLRGRFGSVGDRVPILYGGSVKPENAAELLDAPDVEGLLIGGASLDPHSFASICRLRP
ncbi:MAG: triose-phosphate isomerase [Gemmatimonadota bacterium]